MAPPRVPTGWVAAGLDAVFTPNVPAAANPRRSQERNAGSSKSLSGFPDPDRLRRDRARSAAFGAQFVIPGSAIFRDGRIYLAFADIRQLQPVCAEPQPHVAAIGILRQPRDPAAQVSAGLILCKGDRVEHALDAEFGRHR